MLIMDFTENYNEKLNNNLEGIVGDCLGDEEFYLVKRNGCFKCKKKLSLLFHNLNAKNIVQIIAIYNIIFRHIIMLF